ncbi:MAG: signal peptidase I [Candidatus Paceibacterota bacterium]
MKKILKIIYYILVGFLVLIALLLIISVFPVTGNIKFMTVLSGSMEPAIKTGAIVVAKPANGYKIGDIITFGPNTKTQPPVTHRINDIKVVGGVPVYITKGDANESPDMREIQKSDILGKVLFSIPFVGYAVDFAKKPVGFILIIAVPALVIIFDEIRKIWREIMKLKNKKKDTEQDKEIARLKQEIEKLKDKDNS